MFRTKNRDAYMLFLVRLYEENSESWGLTEEEGRMVIGEVIGQTQMVWEEEMAESDERTGQEEPLLPGIASTGILERLIRWGWLKSDYDDRLNRNVLSFPEYSRLYIELFQKLYREEDGRERESMLSVYSALFTYHSDRDKNHDILRGALSASRSLSMLLSNMQDGMRRYFDELSAQKSFIGIQEVLVEELNNHDSKKYAILTTTDSFYRYKESVKELIAQILNDNDRQTDQLQRELLQGYELREAKEKASEFREVKNEASGFWEAKDEEYACKMSQTAGDLQQKQSRIRRALEFCQETRELVYQIEREFDLIERRYNKLIEQKAIFAKRALARVHYILQEGSSAEDGLLKLVQLMGEEVRGDAICEALGRKLQFSSRYRNLSAQSLYRRKEDTKRDFVPVLPQQESLRESDITDFVPKPLYTEKQLQEFKQKNMQDGAFVATRETVQSVEDLEKLLLLWQEATNHSDSRDIVTLGQEYRTEEGFAFTELRICEQADGE